MKTKENQRPSAFISHDSNDKDVIVRPIATAFRNRFCPIWYDEYSLKVGDNLRESIEKGIREAKKCIVVLTPNYLQNNGWGKAEFDSIFTKELVEKSNIIFPIWYNVSREDIYQYSTYLPNKVALLWPTKENKADEEYQGEIELLVSKLHAEL